MSDSLTITNGGADLTGLTVGPTGSPTQPTAGLDVGLDRVVQGTYASVPTNQPVYAVTQQPPDVPAPPFALATGAVVLGASNLVYTSATRVDGSTVDFLASDNCWFQDSGALTGWEVDAGGGGYLQPTAVIPLSATIVRCVYGTSAIQIGDAWRVLTTPPRQGPNLTSPSGGTVG